MRAKLLAVLVLFSSSAFAQTGTKITGTFKTAGKQTPVQAGLLAIATVSGSSVYGWVNFEPFDSAGNRAVRITCGGITYVPQPVRGWIKGDGTLMAGDGTAGVDVVPNAGCTPTGTVTRATEFLNRTADGRIASITITEQKSVPDQATADWGALAASGIGALTYSGYSTVQDEGAALQARFALNFAGAGVSCVDNAAQLRTDCTISGAAGSFYGTIQDEGVALTQRAVVNFIGTAVSCADNAGAARTDCTLTGGAGSQHSIDGVNLAANDPVNFQDTATLDFTNPSAGNVQAAIKAASVTNAMLAGPVNAVQIQGRAFSAAAPTDGQIPIWNQGTTTWVPGDPIVSGPAAEGAAVANNPVWIAGWDGTNVRSPRLFDADSGVGTQYLLGISLRKIASGGSVELGTSVDPVRIDPTGTTTQPVSIAAASFPDNEPFNLAQIAGAAPSAANPLASRLSDGAAFYDAAKTGQLPAALVGGRLDVNVGAFGVQPAASHTRNEAFAESSAIGGELDDTAPVAATEGNISPVRITANRSLHATMRDSLGDSAMDDANDALRVNVVAGGAGDGKILDGTAAGQADVINTSTAGTEYGLVVRCATGCGGSGGTALADEAAFTEGTTSMTPVGGVLNDTIVSDPTEDQAAAVRITAKRALHVNPRDTDGDAITDQTNNAVRVNVVAGGAGDGKILDGTAAGQADVMASAPAGTEEGLVVRNIPSGTQAVSGTVTANQGGAPWSQNLTQLNSVALASPFDVDTGAGTQNLIGISLRKAASGGSVEFGTSTDPLRVDPTGTTTQPVSGTVTANQGGTWTVQPGNTPNTTAWLVDVSDRAARLVGQMEGRAASGAAKAGNPVQIGGVFNTTQPTVTTGQAVELQATARGALIVGTGVDTFSVTVGAALPAGTNNIGDVDVLSLPALPAGSNNIGDVDVLTFPDNEPFNLAQVNGVAPFLDPCQREARLSANINLTASGQIITGVAAEQTYICSMFLVTATGQNIALVEGTGVTCATGIAGMAGGATAATGQNWAANGGFFGGNGSSWIFKTATAADNVCLLLSGTGQTSGNVSYVQL